MKHALFGLLLAACATSSKPHGTVTTQVDAGARATPTLPSAPKPTMPTPFSCNPPAKADEIYALSARDLSDLEDVSMCQYRGNVLLIVNGASHCGYTPQYKPLQKLHETYAARGLRVLGFPCNQFGAQESGTSKQISDFCTNEYGITFPMFLKLEVNGPSAHPLYKWLKAQPGMSADVAWNFEKFLVSRSGKVVARWLSAVEPSSVEMTSAIEAELAKP